MTTPIADFVKKYADSNVSRFHMPGHKGKNFLGCEALDITEINGADILGAASGIIAQSENNASELFASKHSFYSTEGSSLAIKAMLALIKKKAPTNRRTTVLAARNAHKAFVYACALLDIDARWLYPKDLTHLCACKISASELEAELNKTSSLPDAVYITSPDYLGNIADIKGFSEVCHKYSIPLLVDNAHGAYLAFLGTSLHPLALGADMCCDSAHKTLPVLTGGAYLHVSKNYNVFTDTEIRGMISIFASTSPSYLIMQSLDICNKYISSGYKERLAQTIEKLRELRKKLSLIGFPTSSGTYNEELKLVFSKDTCGYSGVELAQHLSRANIESEFCDEDYLVLMITPELSQKDLDKVYTAFCSLEEKKSCFTQATLPVHKPRAVISIREAIFSVSETVPVCEAEGRICAAPTVSCPPAIPIVISGEIIDKNSIDLFLHYGIENIDVIK